MATIPQNFAPDILEDFLQQELQKDLLRFTTAGSVDDAKSTLIVRLLHDCKAVYEDQLATVKRNPVNRSGKDIDFSLLTYGLRAEREQGITIDVAYRYFSTSRRKFIITDTPGHEQYTRNMATGASTADLAIILLDATKGALAQTRRHAYIGSLLGIPQLVTAINKMDLVGYDKSVFGRLREDFLSLAEGLGSFPVQCIPISALEGDNILERSSRTPWYSDVCFTCSFQAEDVVVLDLLRKQFPDIPVLFLETGYHFAETYEFRDRMAWDWNLNLVNVIPERSVAEQETAFGILYREEPTKCCQSRKVEPLQRALEPYEIWFTGLRREQSITRKNLEKVELHRTPGGKALTKVSPLADWSWGQVWEYTAATKIANLPQYDQGYRSIGCEPCTAIPEDPNNPRAGRWGGEKLECGIHTSSERSE
jgi:phosphoadenosine phosphosulfate reductase